MANLVQFLQYCSQPSGITAVVGFILSVVVDLFPGWSSESPRRKRFVVMGLSFVVPLVALLALSLGTSTWLTADGVFLALQAGFLSFFVSQGRQGFRLSGVGPVDEDVVLFGKN